MTRKDYVLVAGAINKTVKDYTRDWGALGGSERQLVDNLVLNLASSFARDNENFLIGKFSAAVLEGVETNDVKLKEVA